MTPFLKRVPTGHRSHSNAKRRRNEFFKAQRGKCAYCKRRMVKSREKLNSVTLEHRTPLSRGGNHSRKNLVGSCALCNRMKGSMLEADFILYLQKIAAYEHQE